MRPTLAAPSVEDVEALRRPLTGYCYRLLGSAADADDAVQETLIRALAAAERFDPERAALSTWVHRIATNVCIDMLRTARRRGSATSMGLAIHEEELGDPRRPEDFVEPMPESRLVADPGEIASQRETLRLAFVAALQHLARHRQRSARPASGLTPARRPLASPSGTLSTPSTTPAAVSLPIRRG